MVILNLANHPKLKTYFYKSTKIFKILTKKRGKKSNENIIPMCIDHRSENVFHIKGVLFLHTEFEKNKLFYSYFLENSKNFLIPAKTYNKLLNFVGFSKTFRNCLVKIQLHFQKIKKNTQKSRKILENHRSYDIGLPGLRRFKHLPNIYQRFS